MVLGRVARVLTRTGLKLRFGERLVVVQDRSAESDAIATAIAEAADDIGAWVRRIRLEDVVSSGSARPHRALPEVIALAVQDAHACVFVASALHQEAPMRQGLINLARECKLRHAHMPGVRAASFLAGLRADCDDVVRVGEEVLYRVSIARTIRVFSAAGTSLEIDLEPGRRWVAQLGELEAGGWANFPAGALYTSPKTVRGIFVADASLGEFFGAREGLLVPKPVRLHIDGGRVVAVECEKARGLRDDVEAMLAFSANSARVGLIAFGVNFGLDAPIGDVLVDQNAPGIHLGIGDPSGKATGAAWSAPTCFAACEAASSVVVDDEILVQNGSLRGTSATIRSRSSAAHPALVRTPRPEEKRG